MSRSSRIVTTSGISSRGKPGRRGAVSPRRPPAIEPRQAPGLRVSREAQPEPIEPRHQPLPSEVPVVVLSIPEIHAYQPDAVPTELLPRSKRQERAKLAAVAIALVLLAAVMFGGRRNQDTTSPKPVDAAPIWQSTGMPTHQPLPVWKESVVALPPTEKPLLEWTARTQESGVRGPVAGGGSLGGYPDYRVASGENLTEQARRESLDPARPAARIDRIEKLPLEMSNDGTRPSPY